MSRHLNSDPDFSLGRQSLRNSLERRTRRLMLGAKKSFGGCPWNFNVYHIRWRSTHWFVGSSVGNPQMRVALFTSHWTCWLITIYLLMNPIFYGGWYRVCFQYQAADIRELSTQLLAMIVCRSLKIQMMMMMIRQIDRRLFDDVCHKVYFQNVLLVMDLIYFIRLIVESSK